MSFHQMYVDPLNILLIMLTILNNASQLKNRNLVTGKMFCSLTVLFRKIIDRSVLTHPILWLIKTLWSFTFTKWE